MTVTTSPPRSSLAAWQARALHTVTCPSGQRVRIRILGLGTILQAGTLPEDLIDIALIEITSENGAAGAIAKDIAGDENYEITEEQRKRGMERLSEFGRLMRYLSITAIEEVEVEPDVWEPVTLTMDDIDALPEDDLAMVAEIVQRLRGTDARGVTIGVEPLSRWETFRELHSCDEGCSSCEKVIERLSSSNVGSV